MGSTFYSLRFHIVFSTKERRPLIKSSWRNQLHKYLGGTVRGLEGIPEMIGGIEDHVHLLVGLKTTQKPADFIRELKKASSIWASENHDRQFSWQEGYSIFSVSWTHAALVKRYIENQEEHHRVKTFQEEYRLIMKRYKVEWDEKYIWD